MFVLIVKKYIFHIDDLQKVGKKRMTKLLEHPSLWTIYYELLPDLGLCINKKKVKMGGKLCRHIKPSSWWKAIHWWMICLRNQFFIAHVRFTVLHCRSTEICCWNKHGTSRPSHGTQIWLVWGGRKMDEDCLGWVVRRPGEAACCAISAWKVSDQKGSSRMDWNPDIICILINKVHTDIYTTHKLGLNLK